MVVALLNLLATAHTAECVVVEVGIANAYFEFEVPVLAEDKCVSVSDTCTEGPTLITLIGQLTEVGAEETDVILYSSNILLSTDGVEAEEVARKTVAEPVASLGLSHPMTPSCTLFNGPSV